MTITIWLLAAFVVLQLAVGLWIGRRVRGASDFFVAGRRLPALLVFATFLAANIGAGSTVVGDIPPNVTAVGVPARVIKQR